MKKDMARFVRFLRVEMGCSWGRVAEVIRFYYGPLVSRESPNQLYGRELCVKAAEILGEDPSEEPWN